MNYQFQKSHVRLAAIFIPIGLGLGLTVHDWLEYQEGLSSLNWVAANGKILNKTIKAERPGYGRMVFIPTVVYSYHIKEDAFRGERMTFPDHIPAPDKD